jgi:iron complex outermembrane recepter protein
MRTVRSFASLACVCALVCALVCASAHTASAQDDARALPRRGPRFLFLSSMSQMTVPLDVGNTPVLRRRISVNLDGVTLQQALTTISNLAELHLMYEGTVLPTGATVHLRAQDITVAAALTELLIDADVDVVLSSSNHAALVKHSSAKILSEEGSISGSVSETGTLQPVGGAFVRLDDTTRAQTNAGGVFTIRKVTAGVHQVVVQMIGYKPSRVSVTVRDDENSHLSIHLDASPVVLERVQVTATKNAMSVGDVPALTNTVSEDQFLHKGDVKLTQALANIPGLLNSALEGAFESVMLRGMPRSDNEWTTTLLLIDGIPQTDSRNSARVINLPINDVSNIEVVRGPNSALYGGTAIGGVVNILTADPTTAPTFDVELQGGQFHLFRAKATASGPVQGWGGYYVSAAGGENHGFYQQPFPFQIKDNDVYAKFTFSPDSKSHGLISLNNVISDNAIPTPLPVINGTILSDFDPTVNLFANFNLPSANYHQEELRSSFNYERQLGDRVTATEVFGFRRTQYQFQNDGDEIGSPFDTNAQTFTQYPFEETTNENHYYEEARLSLVPNWGSIANTLLIGASYEYHSGHSIGNLIYTDTSTFGWPLSYTNPVEPDRSTWQFFPFGGQRYHVSTLGLYAQYQIAPLPRFSLVLGGRYDRSNLQNNRPGSPRIDASFHAFSPKISGTLKIIHPESTTVSPLHLNLYATYSGAFLPPRSPGSLGPTDTTTLQPEHIRNYEAGIKGDAAGGKVSFDAGLFWMTRRGIIISQREGPFYIPSNAGQENYRGLETSVSWLIASELSVYANGAFYHNRFGTFDIQTSSGDQTLTGNRLPIAPDVIANAGARWQLRSGLGATLNVKHVSSAFMDQDNTFLMPPYTVTDASVFWGSGPVLLALSGHNLFNVRYFTNGDISTAQSIDPAAPRQIVVTTSFRFK